MGGNIVKLDVQPRPLAVVQVRTAMAGWPREFKASLDKVYEAVRAGLIVPSGHNVMVYRHRADGLVDIDCGIETSTAFDRYGELVSRTTPAGTAVTATHVGPYQQLGETHRAIVDWSARNEIALLPTCWEIYGDWEEDASKLRTDIFHLVAD